MRIENLKEWMLVEYYPPREDVLDNRHWPAIIEGVGKLVKCRIFTQDYPEGIVRHVSAKRLVDSQLSLINE